MLLLTYTRRPQIKCAKCHQKRDQQGSGLRFMLGLRRAVCSRCAREIDRMRLRTLR